MSLPKPDLHIRVSDECHQALRMLAYAKGGEEYPISSVASQILEEGVLGRVHTLRITAEMFRGSGIGGTDRERRG